MTRVSDVTIAHETHNLPHSKLEARAGHATQHTTKLYRSPQSTHNNSHQYDIEVAEVVPSHLVLHVTIRISIIVAIIQALSKEHRQQSIHLEIENE